MHATDRLAIMQILFLGAGSAHTVGGDNFQSNMLLTADNGRRLLIDCGSDIRWSLAKQRLSYLDITDIYISHLHADHLGGMEYIGFTTKFDPRCSRPRLYVESSLARPMWDNSLRGGMGLISGSETTLETFFDLRTVVARRPFEWEGIRLEVVPAVHVLGPHQNHAQLWPAHRRWRAADLPHDGYPVTPGHLSSSYSSASVIFHDCESGKGQDRHSLALRRSGSVAGSHTSQDLAIRLPAGGATGRRGGRFPRLRPSWPALRAFAQPRPGNEIILRFRVYDVRHSGRRGNR